MLEKRKSGPMAAAIAGTLLLAGCAGSSGLLGNVPATAATGALPMPVSDGGGATSAAAPRTAAVKGPQASSAAPGTSRLQLVRALRAKGDKTRALAEAERARVEKPGDRELARETGLIALELGQIDKARKALEAALDPASPDWRTLSALGTTLASAGNQREAQSHFLRALELKPDHQATLNNLALSYALDGNLAKAEKTLKSADRAEAPAKVKENLAIVLALAGRYDDAVQVAKGVMAKEAAEANIAYLKTITQSGS